MSAAFCTCLNQDRQVLLFNQGIFIRYLPLKRQQLNYFEATDHYLRRQVPALQCKNMNGAPDRTCCVYKCYRSQPIIYV